MSENIQVEEKVVEQNSPLTKLFSCLNFDGDSYPIDTVDYDYVTNEENTENVLKNDSAKIGAALSIIFSNTEERELGYYNKDITKNIITKINSIIQEQINKVLQNESFKEIEKQWTSIHELYKSTIDDPEVIISIIDVTKEELLDDFETNSVDISSSDFFKKIYTSEYDQYGGEPYGLITGLYEFENTPDDINFLSVMGKICQSAHSPFISAVSPKFFGVEKMADIQDIKNIGSMLEHYRYGEWNNLRKCPHAAYLGLVLPRYLARTPYHPINNPCGKNLLGFTEDIDGDSDDSFVWGNASVLVAKNMAKAFTKTGWCQAIRGPRSGGTVEGLSGYTYISRGSEEKKIPVDFIIPDYRELDFAESGFMPFVYKKESNEGCFFSTNSIKLKEEFDDPKDSEDSQLVANMSYTMSISRIAHYVKIMMRERIGGTDNDVSISNFLNSWLFGYVTTIPDPTPLTRNYHPFKAATVNVKKIDGAAGWYDASISILPHVQFEGMSVELKVDTRLDT